MRQCRIRVYLAKWQPKAAPTRKRPNHPFSDRRQNYLLDFGYFCGIIITVLRAPARQKGSERERQGRARGARRE